MWLALVSVSLHFFFSLSTSLAETHERICVLESLRDSVSLSTFAVSWVISVCIGMVYDFWVSLHVTIKLSNSFLILQKLLSSV